MMKNGKEMKQLVRFPLLISNLTCVITQIQNSLCHNKTQFINYYNNKNAYATNIVSQINSVHSVER